ncbi:TonB-dependent receptor [Chitinophaga vietnamensis]|uniref:TonB-dependent receptor n=1 Tax=Chitinophaga vietnamensis TaxID=2593957 RepID=UPI00117762D8|nr:carboxypeptidase regulatory-like domain-containing protein [Chitinophaga vietnamensis]
MKLLTYILLCCGFAASAQHRISGHVKDNSGAAIPAASVLLNRTPAATTDSAGHFQVRTNGRVVLGISSVGYRSWKQELPAVDTSMDIVLQPDARGLQMVTVSAGAFEASDKAKGASLTPIDAVTVAGSNADITQALRSLPGAQQIGEQDGLFVRGGASDETKQFIDGALLKNPNYPAVPGITQYARVNPFLFKGILFSTGGYSALYGQAMSSALIMESVDLPEKSSASFSLFPANMGGGMQHLAADKRSSYGLTLRYSDQSWYNRIVPQQPDYFAGPRYFEGDANFRIRTGKTGMLKFYTNWNSSTVGMNNPDIDSGALRDHYQVRGRNSYNNLSYRSAIGRHWKMELALAYSYNRNHATNQLIDSNNAAVIIHKTPYDYKHYSSLIDNNFAQGRAVFTYSLPRGQALRFGAEHFYSHDQGKVNDTAVAVTDHLSAAFAEGDIYLANNLAAKVGIRLEHSSLLQQWVAAPRISLAYRLPDGGQFNLAYGIFYQEPATAYLYHVRGPGFSSATHYVLNYTKKANNRFFRVEAYYKKYAHLLRTVPELNDNGDGYAKGVEFFFRDKKSIRNLDYWISYTFLDTKRTFLDYPYALQPTFAAPHTATIAIKKFIQSISTSVNVSYAVAAGRPYYDIRYDGRLANQGTTRPYSVMNLHVAYLAGFFKHWKNKDFSGIAFGVNNIFGNKQEFGYRYSYDGRYKTPVTLPAARSYFLGVFLSFGIDRTADFLNNDL